jgi:hypothetical protein
MITKPTDNYRLMQKKDGTIYLQRAYLVQDGEKYYYKWQDEETVREKDDEQG